MHACITAALRLASLSARTKERTEPQPERASERWEVHARTRAHAAIFGGHRPAANGKLETRGEPAAGASVYIRATESERDRKPHERRTHFLAAARRFCFSFSFLKSRRESRARSANDHRDAGHSPMALRCLRSIGQLSRWRARASADCVTVLRSSSLTLCSKPLRPRARARGERETEARRPTAALSLSLSLSRAPARQPRERERENRAGHPPRPFTGTELSRPISVTLKRDRARALGRRVL